jgi:hypothetical protein
MGLLIRGSGHRAGAGLGARRVAVWAAGPLAAILAALPAATLTSSPGEDCSCTADLCRKCPHAHRAPHDAAADPAEARPSPAPPPCHGPAAHAAGHGEAQPQSPRLLSSCGDSHGPAAAHFEIRVALAGLPPAGQPERADLVALVEDDTASHPAPPPAPPPPRPVPAAC